LLFPCRTEVLTSVLKWHFDILCCPFSLLSFFRVFPRPFFFVTSFPSCFPSSSLPHQTYGVLNWLLLLSPGARALAGALKDKAGLTILGLYNNGIGVEG
jgi:hypothetical protein